jgi:hypothetical protein
MKVREKRLDWAICWPVRNKHDAFCGVVRLSLTDQKYWVGIYCATGAPIGLRVTERDGLKESFSCSLEWCSYGRWRGWLPFGCHNFEARVACSTAPQTGQRIYRVHFAIGRRTEQ